MRPQYRRFGFVDFDAMGSAVAGDLDPTDEIVIRQNGGDNVVASISQIPVGGGVPDPLLLNDGSAADPTYSFTSDPDTGIFNVAANVLGIAIGGSLIWVVGNTSIGASGGTGAEINIGPPSATVPTLRPEGDDVNTGIGRAAADQLSLIAGGVQIAQAKEVVGANQFIIAPGVVQNNAAAPSLGFGSGNMGFYQINANILAVSIAGVAHFVWETDGDFLFRGSSTGGPTMMDETASATNPVFVFQNDRDTGLGSATPDQLNFIAGGLTCMSVSEVGGARRIGFYEGAPIALQTGVAVTTAAVHAALVNLRLITT